MTSESEKASRADGAMLSRPSRPGEQLVHRRSARARVVEIVVVCLATGLASAALAEIVLLLTATPSMAWEWRAFCTGVPIGMVLLPVSLFGWARARQRGESTRTYGLSIVLVAASSSVIFTGFGLDTPERAVRRAAPLIEAIRGHVSDTGVPPRQLQDLVPKYLTEVPERLTRSFHVERYEPDTTAPLGFRLVISGVVGLSSQWLDYNPSSAVPVGGRSFDRSRSPRRIGDWVWNETTF